MSYKELHAFCQTLSPKVHRNDIRDKACELSGRSVATVRLTLDTSVCRGFYLSARNADSPIVHQFGGKKNIIVLARDQNYCWERGVYVKELMHLFDDPDCSTATAAEFEKLVFELTNSSLQKTQSPQTQSEIDCLIMALGLFCPGDLRNEYRLALKDGAEDFYSIALKLSIPRKWVELMVRPEFEDHIGAFL